MTIGVIFDWDGVIINSMNHHKESWELLAVEESRSLPPDHFEKGFGKKNEEIIPQILAWTSDTAEIKRLSLRKEALYRECLTRDGLVLLPGVRPFLDMLRANNVSCAIGSSTHRLNIETALAVTDIRTYFKTIVSSEDVTLGKPNPQVFLTAAQRIGIDPRHCIVLEDVPAGIAAAHRGGMKAVAVSTTHPRERLVEADRIVDRLDQLSYDDLLALVGNG
jgi:beta-phosphoglucomutase family hydrolase